MASAQEPLDDDLYNRYAALDLAQLGLHVVPILPGGKRPAWNDWVERATVDTAVITKHWTAHPDHGVGIATGHDGVFVIDEDITDGKSGDDTMRRLEREHGALPATLTCRTGSGGRHRYLRAPDGIEIRNDAGRRFGPGVDIRGVGGQAVAPPTLHPCGEYYTWLDCSDIAPAPAWLLDLLRDDDADDNDPQRVHNVDPDDDRPGTWFINSTTWDELLERDGWTRHHRDQSGEEHWARPGKDRREGSSATVGYQGLPILHVFTSSVPGLEADTSYNRFGYYAATQHGGDHSAAARALRPDMPAGDLHAWLRDTNKPLVDRVVDESDDEEPGPYSYRDLTEAWDGNKTRRVPEVGRRDDGRGLFYRGNVNSVHGESGDGKSYAVLRVAGDEVRRGHHVLWIDCEEPDELTVVERLQNLRVTRTAAIGQFHYVCPTGAAPTDQVIAALVADITRWEISLVVIDSVGEALGVVGLSGMDDDDVTKWMNLLPRPLAAVGAAVVLIDHTTKAGNNNQYASGSQRKRAAITGVTYSVENRYPFSRQHRGMSVLTCAKDRHGTYAKDQEVALMWVTPEPDGGVSIVFEAPDEMSKGDKDAEKIWALTKEVVNVVELAGTLKLAEVRAKIPRRPPDVIAAVDAAVRVGALKEMIAARGAKHLEFVRALCDDDRPAVTLTREVA